MLKQFQDYISKIDKPSNLLAKNRRQRGQSTTIPKLPRLSFSWFAYWKEINTVYFERKPSQQISRLQGILREFQVPTDIREEAEIEPHIKQEEIDIQTQQIKEANPEKMQSQNNEASIQMKLMRLAKKRKRLTNRLKNPISQLLVKNNEQIFQQNSPQDKQTIKKYMKQVISEKEVKIFALSILKISNQLFDFVNIQLDKCFGKNKITTSCENITRLIGLPNFIELREARNINFNERWCHSCRKIIKQTNTITCKFKEKYDPKRKFGTHSNPFTLLKSKSKIHQKQVQEFSYPYLQYRIEDGFEVCGRSYCFQCLNNYNFDKNQFLCPFCVGSCQCQRCITCDQIIKYQGQYIFHGGIMEDLLNESIVYQTMRREQDFQQKETEKKIPRQHKIKKIQKKRNSKNNSLNQERKVKQLDRSETSTDIAKSNQYFAIRSRNLQNSIKVIEQSSIVEHI